MPITLPGQIAVWSETATHIDLCLFDHPQQAVETARIPLERSGDQWTRSDVILPHGQLYGLRADGASDTETKSRFSPERLLLDPRARAIGRAPAPLDPLGVVIIDDFDWQGDVPPAIPWRDTVIYEAHVTGLTALCPAVSLGERGTFLGVAAPAVIAHLRELGVTAIELLPVHAHADEPALRARGLTNYWGYNTLSFFAPDPRFATSAVRSDPSAAVREFKAMVRELHRAGIEVILDVVYNHTAEGSADGPTLSWRGLDPIHAYRRRGDDPSAYDDWTGCGNTFNVDHAIHRALVIDSLRDWVTEMHVDGFRFDLASALDRFPGSAESFFREVQQDAVLGRVKLIAEPWDATGSGYRLGAFSAGIAEWNGKYRDIVRRFWRGDAGAAAEFATRISGSQDLFSAPDRSPLHSINFVTAHDGFTLADLVSYNYKHNEANGEYNRDGESDNFSSNAGVEGPAMESHVIEQRATRRRSLLATLALSIGVPMICGGDEVGRSQRGNNNAYCQDNALSWTPWPGDTDINTFARAAFALRREHACLRRTDFLTATDARWISPDGSALADDDWQSHALNVFGLHLPCDDDTSLLIYMNASRNDVLCQVPEGKLWQRVLDSASPAHRDDVEQTTSSTLRLSAGSVVVLKRLIA